MKLPEHRKMYALVADAPAYEDDYGVYQSATQKWVISDKCMPSCERCAIENFASWLMEQERGDHESGALLSDRVWRIIRELSYGNKEADTLMKEYNEG